MREARGDSSSADPIHGTRGKATINDRKFAFLNQITRPDYRSLPSSAAVSQSSVPSTPVTIPLKTNGVEQMMFREFGAPIATPEDEEILLDDMEIKSEPVLSPRRTFTDFGDDRSNSEEKENREGGGGDDTEADTTLREELEEEEEMETSEIVEDVEGMEMMEDRVEAKNVEEVKPVDQPKPTTEPIDKPKPKEDPKPIDQPKPMVESRPKEELRPVDKPKPTTGPIDKPKAVEQAKPIDQPKPKAEPMVEPKPTAEPIHKDPKPSSTLLPPPHDFIRMVESAPELSNPFRQKTPEEEEEIRKMTESFGEPKKAVLQRVYMEETDDDETETETETENDDMEEEEDLDVDDDVRRQIAAVSDIPEMVFGWNGNKREKMEKPTSLPLHYEIEAECSTPRRAEFSINPEDEEPTSSEEPSQSIGDEGVLQQSLLQLQKQLRKTDVRCSRLEKICEFQQRDIDSLRYEVDWKDKRIEYLQKTLQEMELSQTTTDASSTRSTSTS